MNCINKNLFYCWLLLSISPGLFSCKKFVEIPPPANMIVGETVFSNDKTATSAIVGLYTSLMENTNSLLNGDITIYPGLSSDELNRNYRSENFDAFLNNAITVNNDKISSMWSFAYKEIYQTNAIIEGVTKSSGMSKAMKSQLTGEAKFVRSLVYFYLINLFGDVPLITTTDYNVSDTLSRASVEDIYQKIIVDLKEAQINLSDEYITSPSSPGERIRPNRLAATALLARVYLYEKDYLNSALQAGVVINSGYYSLEEDLNKVFLPESKEAILQLFPVNQYVNTSEGNNFVPFDTSAPPVFSLTDNLLTAFDSNDQRLVNWTKTYSVADKSYTYPYKYKVGYKSPSDQPTEYNTVLRLAEMYLVRAEARAQQNDISGSQEDLNIIRRRAGLNNTPASNQTDLLLAIEHERQIEFFAEWGHRWFDLKRTGRANLLFAIAKGSNWQATDALYPIPLYEIRSNSRLFQNAGY